MKKEMEKSSIKNPIENRNYGFDLMSGCLIIYMIFCHPQIRNRPHKMTQRSKR